MPIFYEITAPNGKKSHLFGTIHLGDFDLKVLPPEIESAFTKASRCVFEVDIMNPQERAAAIMSAKEVDCSPEHQDRVIEILNLFYPHESEKFFKLASQFNPIEIAEEYIRQKSSEVSVSTGDQLDLTLMKRAKNHHKNVFFLETFLFQYERINGLQFSYAEHMTYLEFVVSLFFPEPKVSIRSLKMVENYLAGDVSELECIWTDELLNAETTPSVVKQYHYGLLGDRDHRMANNLEIHLDTGSTFVAIGVAHLKGIAEILRQKGYQVVPIKCSPRPTSLVSGFNEILGNSQVLPSIAPSKILSPSFNLQERLASTELEQIRIELKLITGMSDWKVNQKQGLVAWIEVPDADNIEPILLALRKSNAMTITQTKRSDNQIPVIKCDKINLNRLNQAAMEIKSEPVLVDAASGHLDIKF